MQASKEPLFVHRLIIIIKNDRDLIIKLSIEISSYEDIILGNTVTPDLHASYVTRMLQCNNNIINIRI